VPKESFQDLYLILKDRHRHLDSRAPKPGSTKIEDVKRHVFKVSLEADLAPIPVAKHEFRPIRLASFRHISLGLTGCCDRCFSHALVEGHVPGTRSTRRGVGDMGTSAGGIHRSWLCKSYRDAWLTVGKRATRAHPHLRGKLIVSVSH
jgi:hypothetical protein